MKNIAFKLALANSNKRINGTFVHLNGKGGTITLEETLCGDWKFEVSEQKEIQNPGNFLAAFFCRIDTDKVIDRIIINRKPTKLVREKPETTLKAILINGEAFTPDVTVKMTDIDGNTIEMPVTELASCNADFQEVTLPKDGKYTKNAFLNSVLWDNRVCLTEAKNITPRLLSAYGKLKQNSKKSNSPVPTYYILACEDLKNIILESTDEDKVIETQTRYSHKKGLKLIKITESHIDISDK
ncbi:hypothetical protein [Vibrio harveyi]|uniref:hypothetical protein n=1 Tax=Vibrio harveyi TaxID=669 RepID=UPI003CE6FD86